MMRKISIYILVACLASGCAGNKQGSGAAIGALTGGLVGSLFGKGSGQLLAVGAGAIAGGLIGSSIGQSLDEKDRELAESNSNHALEYSPTGQSTNWRNPDTGHYGYITPKRTYRNDYGEYCREYTHVIVVGGSEEKAYGKACRKPDGHWQIVNS